MDAFGRLQVRVYTSRAQIPVVGATVVVTRRTPQGKYELLSIQETGESGTIRPVEIAAPPAGESTSPGNAGTAFALCDVWAEHPGFAVLLVEGVQIFPGVDTMQEMMLTPLSEGQNSLGQTDLRNISAQNL